MPLDRTEVIKLESLHSVNKFGVLEDPFPAQDIQNSEDNKTSLWIDTETKKMNRNYEKRNFRDFSKVVQYKKKLLPIETYNLFELLAESSAHDKQNPLDRTEVIKLESLHSVNRFRVLDDPFPAQDIQISVDNKMSVSKDMEIEKTNRSNEKKIFKDLSKVVQHKKKLPPIETYNRFELLAESSEEDIDRLSNRVKILMTAKNNLQKCKTCNFKKRKCHLDPQKCQAKQKLCFVCKKIGHYPQSVCCKINRRKKD